MSDGCSAEQIKEHCKGTTRRVEKVLTPDWGEPGYVYVRGLKMGENALTSELAKKDGLPEAEQGRANMAAWCVACVCDKDGVRKFSDADMECLMDLEGPLTPVYKCFDEATRLNGITSELVKNSEKTRSANSK